MDFVRPWLAVGTADEAADPATRRRRGIDAVLSLMPADFCAGETHLALPVADRVALPTTTIRAATAFIEVQRLAGRTTLVHCKSGVSRSPALATCYLREYAGRPLPDALAEVVRARPQAAPHRALLESIATHYGDAPLPEADALVDLSANENAFGASPLALAAAASASAAAHRYPDREGRALRTAIAARHGGTPEQVVLGNGSCQILDLAARAFLSPGDSALVVAPCFPAYASAVRRAGGRVVELRRAGPAEARDRDAGLAAIDLDAVSAAIDHSTRLVFLASPNNPTGDGLGASTTCNFLERTPPGVVVVLDEAYRDYCDADADCGEERLADGAAFVAAGRRLLVVRSFSKLYGLAGLRVGYGFGPADLVARLDAARPAYNVNAIALAAAQVALADEAHAETVRRATAAGRAALSAGLSALGCAVLPAHANFVLVRPPLRANATADHLAAALAERGVLVKPGRAFGLPEHLRIGVGRPEDHRRLFSALAEILASPVEAHSEVLTQTRS